MSKKIVLSVILIFSLMTLGAAESLNQSLEVDSSHFDFAFSEDIESLNSDHLSDRLPEEIPEDAEVPEAGYIVELEDRHGIELAQDLNTQGFDVEREFDNLFNGFSVRDLAEEDIDALEDLYSVKAVHREEVYYPLTSEGIESINADSLEDIDHEDVDGEGIRIGVVDTGVDYTHPDLGGCTTEEFEQGDCDKVVDGYDFVDNNEDPMDTDGHGTHVAGISSADGDLEGVAPESEVLAYRALSSFGGTTSDIIASIEQAVEDDADVIGLSLGGDGDPDDALSSAVDDASEDALVVVAAGNDGALGKDSVASPGTARNALTVGATDYEGNLTSFSSRGPVLWFDESYRTISKPDVVAPGQDINSTYLSNGYDELSGTSMATPMVSGVAALLFEQEPELSSEEAKSRIKSSSNPLGDEPWKFGSGMVDAENLLEEDGLVIESFDFEDIDESGTKTVSVENPSDSTFDLDLSFDTQYNLTDGEDQVSDVFSVEQGSLLLEPGESADIEVEAESTDSGVYTSYLVLEDSSKSYIDKRSVVASIGDLQEGEEFSAMFTENGEQIMPGFSRLYNESGFVGEISALGDPVELDPGDYTYVAGYSVGVFDAFTFSNSNFLYVESFTLEEDDRYDLEQEVTDLDSFVFENSVDDEDILLTSTTIGYEKGESRHNFTNPAAMHAYPGSQDIYYGGDLEEVDEWYFGGSSREYFKDWEQEEEVSVEELEQDWLNSSEKYVDFWSFDPVDSPYENINFDFSNERTVEVENQGVYPPYNNPSLESMLDFDSESFIPVMSLQMMPFPQTVSINFDEDKTDDVVLGGVWSGDFTEFNDEVGDEEFLGGLPALPPSMGWNQDGFSFDQGFGHDGSSYVGNWEVVDIELSNETDSSSFSDSSYWEGFSTDFEGDSLSFDVNFTTDFGLQTLTRVNGELESEGDVPRIVDVENWSPVIEEDSGWEATFVHDGEEASAYVRENEDWSLESESSSGDTVSVDLDHKESLDIKVALEDSSDSVNYTFENFAHERNFLGVDINEESDEGRLEGTVTESFRTVEDIRVKNYIEGERVGEDFSYNGFDLEEETCSYRSQRLEGPQVLFHDLDETVQEAADFEPVRQHLDAIHPEQVNPLDFEVLDSCEFEFRLETNETGTYTNETINDEGEEEFTYLWSNDEGLEAGEYVEFRLWMGEEDEEWFSTEYDSFELRDLEMEVESLQRGADSLVESSLKGSIDINSSEGFSYESSISEKVEFVDYETRYVFDDELDSIEGVSTDNWERSTYSYRGSHSAEPLGTGTSGSMTLDVGDVDVVEFMYHGHGEVSFDGEEVSLDNRDSSEWERMRLDDFEDDSITFDSHALAIDDVRAGSLEEVYGYRFSPRNNVDYTVNVSIRYSDTYSGGSDDVIDYEVFTEEAGIYASPEIGSRFSPGSGLMEGDEFSESRGVSAPGFTDSNLDVNVSADSVSSEFVTESGVDDLTGESFEFLKCPGSWAHVDCPDVDFSYIPEQSGFVEETLTLESELGTDTADLNSFVYSRENVEFDLEEERRVEMVNNSFYSEEDVFEGFNTFEVPGLEPVDDLEFSWDITVSNADSFSSNDRIRSFTVKDVPSLSEIDVSTIERADVEVDDMVFDKIYHVGFEDFDEEEIVINHDIDSELTFTCSSYNGDECGSNWVEQGSSSSYAFEEGNIEAFAVGRYEEEDEDEEDGENGDEENGEEDDNGDGDGTGEDGENETQEEQEEEPSLEIDEYGTGFEITGIYEGSHEIDLNSTGLPIENIKFESDEDEGTVVFERIDFSEEGNSIYDDFSIESSIETGFEVNFTVSDSWLENNQFERTEIMLIEFEDAFDWSVSETGYEESTQTFETNLNEGSYGIGVDRPCYSMDPVDAAGINQCQEFDNPCEVPDYMDEVESCADWGEASSDTSSSAQELRDELEDLREDNPEMSESQYEEIESRIERGDLDSAESGLNEVEAQFEDGSDGLISNWLLILFLITVLLGGVGGAGYWFFVIKGGDLNTGSSGRGSRSRSRESRQRSSGSNGGQVTDENELVNQINGLKRELNSAVRRGKVSNSDELFSALETAERAASDGHYNLANKYVEDVKNSLHHDNSI